MAASDLDIAVQYAVESGDLPAEAEFVKWARAALTDRDEPAELCIRVVDEPEGRALNRDYRGRNYATNVLSFPVELPPGVDSPMLGDLVLCAPVVAREAVEQGKDATAHWAHLTVHGILHLLGHDHDSDAEAESMEALEARILSGLGFPDPYATDKLESSGAEEEAEKPRHERRPIE